MVGTPLLASDHTLACVLCLFSGDAKEAEEESKLECAQRGYFRKTVHKERQQLCVHAEGIESDIHLTHLNYFVFKSVLCD